MRMSRRSGSGTTLRSSATRTTTTTWAGSGRRSRSCSSTSAEPSRPLLSAPGSRSAFLGDGRRAIEALAENHYLATDELARALGLGEEVRESLRQSYERWDGKGAYGMKGEEIAVSSRLINLADVVEVFRRTGGVEAAVAVARERSGTQFDPELVDVFCEQAPMLFERARRRRRAGKR